MFFNNLIIIIIIFLIDCYNKIWQVILFKLVIRFSRDTILYFIVVDDMTNLGYEWHP